MGPVDIICRLRALRDALNRPPPVREGAGRGDEGQVAEEVGGGGRGGRRRRGEQDGGAGAAARRAEAERHGGGAGESLMIKVE